MNSPNPITAGIGHNEAPLQEALPIRHQAITDRVKELLASVARAPERIDDDVTQGKIGDLYKLLSAAHKKGEAARVEEKEPFLMGQRTVDSFFKTHVTSPLEQAMMTLKKRSDVYLQAKVAAERRAREEEARKAREEEQRKLEAARKAEEENRLKTAAKKLDEAVVAANVAAQAEEAAAAPAAQLSQTRGEHSLAGVAMVWTHEVEDFDAIDLNSIREFISRDDIEKALRAFVRLHKGTRQIHGVRIFEAPRTNFR